MKRSHLLLPALLIASLGATSLRTALTSSSYARQATGAEAPHAEAAHGSVAGDGAAEVRQSARTALGSAAAGIAAIFFPAADAPRRDPYELAMIRNQIRAHEAGTYIGEMLLARDSALARWPERRDRPVRIWIQPASRVADWMPGYVDEVRTAFESWDALEIPVRFTFVADSSAAEVTVQWIDRFQEPISGRTRWARDGNWWITDASISLAVHHRNGDQLDLDSMHAMALHEIGHLLGLDHTSDQTSIMAPRVRVRELSAADSATVRLLYSVPPGELR